MTHHLLIDVDSKIPNLALMKVSGWAKARGDSVDFRQQTEHPDHVWISCIFTWNKSGAVSASTWYPQAQVHMGGTGFDWGKPRNQRIQLPPEVEASKPDYSLYGDDRAVGFCQRGCDRKCSFCDVWKKEGRIRDNGYKRLTDWVPKDFHKIILLDNDMALLDDAKHDQILQDAKDNKWKLCISQGYDFRCLDKRRAELLASHKPWDIDFKERRIYVAWDYLGIERWVRRGIKLLLDAGFKGREIYCYMICGFNTTHEQDYYRFRVLAEEYGVKPFVMRYNRRNDDPWLNAFARWVNRGLYDRYHVSFEDYQRGILQELLQK